MKAAKTVEKLSKEDAHLLGLKRKFVLDQIHDQKKQKILESQKKIEIKPFWLDHPNVLGDILGKP